MGASNSYLENCNLDIFIVKKIKCNNLKVDYYIISKDTEFGRDKRIWG